MTVMTKRTKAILAVAVALTVACASAAAEPQPIDLPYVDVSSHDDRYRSPPIWTNTKDKDDNYCGPGSGRSISRCPGLGRGGHTFPGDPSGAPGAGPGDYGDEPFRRRRYRRTLDRRSSKRRLTERGEISMPNSDLHLDDVHLAKRGEISMPNSDLRLDDVHLARRGLVNMPASDLHLEDVHLNLEKNNNNNKKTKRQDTYYDPEKDPEPDVFENDVKIYKRASSAASASASASNQQLDGVVEAVVAEKKDAATGGALQDAKLAMHAKRAVVIYDKEPHLEENAGSFDELMPAAAQPLKRQDTYYDPKKDPEPDVFENDVRIYKRQVEDEDEEEQQEEAEEHLFMGDDEDWEEEDEAEERRLDEEAGLQDWIEEMKMEELFELDSRLDALHLHLDESHDRNHQTASWH